MPRKISQAEVVNQVYKEYVIGKLGIEDIVSYTQPYLPIIFTNFERAMMRDEFITTSTTIRQKWKGLIASEIIIPVSRDAGKINLIFFRSLLYLNKNISHTQRINTENTHTEEESQ